MKRLFFTENDCYKANVNSNERRYTAFQERGPTGVMIHSTGANNPYLKRYVGPDDGYLGENPYGNHWNRPGLDVCVHAFIGRLESGEVETYQVLPVNFRGWHCGGPGNDTHYSIEICEDGLDDPDYFREVWIQAVELTCAICEKLKLDPMTAVIDHYEGFNMGIASGHSDISHWARRHGKNMDDFREDVARMMKGETIMTQSEVLALIAANGGGVRYNTLGEVPSFYRPELDYLVSKGYLKGREGTGEDMVLDMTEDGIRTLVVLARRFMEQDV